jgi:hypothetical protein
MEEHKLGLAQLSKEMNEKLDYSWCSSNSNRIWISYFVAMMNRINVMTMHFMVIQVPSHAHHCDVYCLLFGRMQRGLLWECRCQHIIIVVDTALLQNRLCGKTNFVTRQQSL